MTDTRKRVKLYALNLDRQWDDKGTGHVSSNYVERLKGISLLVRAEADGKTSFASDWTIFRLNSVHFKGQMTDF